MLKRLLLVAALLSGMAGFAQSQVLMPGPSATLINGVAATTTSSGFSIAGYGITAFQVVTSTAGNATGTVAFQGSMDNSNWSPLTCWLNGTTTAASTTQVGATAASTSINALYQCNTDGIAMVRAVLSPWQLGTFTVTSGVSAMPRAK